MKAILFGALSLLTVTSTLAAPAGEAELSSGVNSVEERDFFNLWNPGKKPYKYKFECVGKPVHDKYLCEKPGKDGEPSHLGYKQSQKDYQFYLSPGQDNHYKYKDYDDDRDVCLAGPYGYEYICPVKEPPKYHFPKDWDCKYDKWWISPIYKVIDWWKITLEFFKEKKYWDLKDYGWKWVCYEDGKGGWDVKAWDGKYKVEKEYFECKIIVEPQYKQWGFPWGH
ncbi:MAG: hypothetical protein Q9181_008233 [Wetmoreana brouardii]